MQVVVRLQPRDLANIRFSISPVAHLLLGAAPDSPYPAARRWWRRARGNAPAAAAEVVQLLRAKPMFTPDFLTPPIALDPRRPAPSIADELDAIRAVGQARLERELSSYDDLQDPPRAVSALRDGGRGVDRLADSVYALYRACLADDWPDIERRLRADLGYRAGVLAERGVEAMLDSLAPGQVDHSALAVSGGCGAPGRVELAMDGRGFLLSPNVFLDDSWAFSISPWQQPFLVYPTARQAEPPASAHTADPLAALIGRGRVAALRAVGAGCTTGELASRLAVSAPTASVHATALREAGLLASARDGREVMHTVTALGAGLLLANPAPASVLLRR
jgi:DNA-binding transcriptional ArsR family regulator